MKTRNLAIAPAAVLTLLLAALLPAPAVAAEPRLDSRKLQETFPAGQTVRLANLAGRVDLVPARGNQVVVEATIYAEAGGKTRVLLEGMKWVKTRDKKGRQEWALSYPVGDYRGFHYPRPRQEDLPSFLSFLDNGYTSTVYRGERVRIYSRKRSGVPTLYANLRIGMPAGSTLVVRNVVGQARGGGNLEGNLTVDTGSGDVQIAAFTGQLTVDTGSGDVKLGGVKGETSVDTGSGDIEIARLVGNGELDTGSGDVVVEKVAAGKLAVDTGSGDVTIHEGTVGRLMADTGSGDVEVAGVEVEELAADTGSGDVVVQSALAKARRLTIGTGSGDVHIAAGAGASFDIDSDQGSGTLRVGYSDASLRHEGKKVVGARRGDGRTAIRVETGSGDCTIAPERPES